MADAAGGGPLLGSTLELRVGAPAHGGSCVARHPDPDGRVVFVRHALPGETVRALVTEDRGGSFCRADAIEVLVASPDRVEPPCPHAGPGRCGGCDWQHATGPAQRQLKAEVIRDQFQRLAHLDVGPLLEGVAELPGGLLGWRTRTLYARASDGALGLRRHGSHEVVPLECCPLGAPGVAEPPVQAAPGLVGVELVRGEDDEVAVLEHRPGRGRQPRGRRPPDRVEQRSGPERLRRRVDGREFEVRPGVFWQIHPAAAATFAATLVAAVRPRPGERVLDLYAGAGALTAALAEAVGPEGAVIGVESSAAAVADAGANLGDLPHAEVRRGRITAAELTGLTVGPDVVTLDPPRSGAGREVMAAILQLAPRAVGYVACDPAALARDVAVAVDQGWSLASLQAFDAFPMTQHVECVALLLPPGGG